MRLTVEEHREAIKRYGHIRRARGWKPVRCSANLSGTARGCTREPGHAGPHVCHGRLGRVLAVWDEGVASRGGGLTPSRKPPKGTRSPVLPTRLEDEGLLAAVKAFGKRVVRQPQYFLEEAVFLVFFLGMVAFVIDWALRLLGVR